MIILVFLVLSWLGSTLSLGRKLPEGLGVAARAREDGNGDGGNGDGRVLPAPVQLEVKRCGLGIPGFKIKIVSPHPHFNVTLRLIPTPWSSK